MDMVKVSIIVPVYQVSAYIERCMRSVMSQTYPHIECIIVNDASSDDGMTKCREALDSYDGPITFRFMEHPENRGLSAARNSGLGMATGDYVYFLDSDDELLTDSIEKLVAPVINDSSIEVVQGNYICQDHIYGRSKTQCQKGVCKWQIQDISGNQEIRFCYFKKKQIPVTAWNKLISRAFLMRNQLRFIEGQLFEDILWTFYMMKSIKHMYLVPDVTYIYYKRRGSIKDATPFHEVLSHYGSIYNDIASHLTKGSELLETHSYSYGFCLFYLHNQRDKNFQYAYKKFMKVLSKDKLSVDRFLLFGTHVLSRWTPIRYLKRGI